MVSLLDILLKLSQPCFAMFHLFIEISQEKTALTLSFGKGLERSMRPSWPFADAVN